MIKHAIKSREGGTKVVSLSPLKAIRFQCLECMGYSACEVRNCTGNLCSLYPFRLGKVPGHKGKGNASNLIEK
ncbi:MAG: hypothetical protein HOG49_19055 [Candidatus Scalindua sp.]|nr:hypothetical protein [Candidatus Scalindua sp.]